MSDFSVFSVVAGLIAEVLFTQFIMLYNGLNIAEYEAYWLINFPLVNDWGAQSD